MPINTKANEVSQGVENPLPKTPGASLARKRLGLLLVDSNRSNEDILSQINEKLLQEGLENFLKISAHECSFEPSDNHFKQYGRWEIPSIIHLHKSYMEKSPGVNVPEQIKVLELLDSANIDNFRLHKVLDIISRAVDNRAYSWVIRFPENGGEILHGPPTKPLREFKSLSEPYRL